MSDILEHGFVRADGETLVPREGATKDVSPRATLTEAMLHRICSEYIEMPGLCVTRKQAQRLWGLDEDACAKALQILVESKFLCETNGMYRRLTEGPIAFPPLRMARVQIAQRPGTARVGVRGGLAL